MKILVLIIFGILLVGTTFAYYVCQDETDNDYIPCQVITPKITCTGDYNVSITNLNTSVVTSVNFTDSPIGDGTYNFTFSGTGVGNSFSLRLCDDSTATISIIQDEDPDVNLWWVILVVFFFLLIGGFVWGNYLFFFLDGVLMILTGLWVFQNGISIYAVTQWWVYPFAWILMGIGLLLSIYSGYQMLEDYAGGKF